MSENLHKRKRVVDFEVLQKVKRQLCLLCVRKSDPCHIRSVGSGGPDTEWNVIPLCRDHHREQHNKGWAAMMRKYITISWKLESLGWKITEKGGVWNEKLREFL